MGKHACEFIGEYLQNVRSLFLKHNKSEERTNRVWIGRLGNPMTKGDIIRVVRLYRNKTGIEKQVTPHSFRRTLAVELIRNECDFLTVKSILGYSKSETTLQYCALAGEELKDALRRCHPRFNAKEGDITPKIDGIGDADNE
jgi:integrase/recombinase XerD